VDKQDRRRIEEAEGYLELGLPQRAFAALENASAAAKAAFEWRDLAAKSLVGDGRYEEAVPQLYAALDLNPNAVPLLLALADCFKKTRQYSRAIETMRTAEKLCRRGSNADSHAAVSFGLSGCFALARRKGDMLHWLERALNEDGRLRKNLVSDPDFDEYRRDPDFLSLMQQGAPF
jgi:tetratricopeptide (TPR) repeat protein